MGEARSWPSLRRLNVHIAGRQWSVTFSEDLADALLTGDEAAALTADALAVLAAALIVPGAGAWRLGVDVNGLLLGLAVDGHRLHLGSPRFASERLLLAALGEEQHEEAAAWRHHVGAWLGASPTLAPLDVARSTARHGHAELLDPSDPAADPEGPLLRRVDALARQVAGRMKRYRPGLLERLSRVGLGLQADYAILRVHVLRFVALLPSLDHDVAGAEIQRLLAEMLRRMCSDSEQARADGRRGQGGPLPVAVVLACHVGAWVTASLPARWIAWATRAGVRKLARSFIAGEDMAEAGPALAALARSGRSATLDQLGELVVREAEADRYCERVIELVQGSGAPGEPAQLNGAGIPLGHVSVKVSALCAHYDPDDPEGTWRRVGPRLFRIVDAAREREIFINLDAEHYSVRDLTFHMLERLAGPGRRFADYPWLGIVVQAYLRDGGAHLEEVLAFCRARGVRVPIRLVKGAYWDEEGTEAHAHGYDSPQFRNKAETDVLFQQLALRILAAGDVAQLCVGSHNLRDHCFARAAREAWFPQAPPVEHQALHATYEALSQAMADLGWPTRNYVPVGSLLVGMAYLVRRIMENSSQVGVLTMARHGVDLPTVLARPGAHLQVEIAARHLTATADDAQWPPFENVAPVRLYRPDHRRAFDAAVALRRFAPGLGSPHLGDHCSGPVMASTSPSDESEVVGEIRFADVADVPGALDAAAAAAPAWAARGAQARAVALVRAAEIMRARRLDLAVLVGLEGGKARLEALADVDESIDFLQFYGREAIRLEASQQGLEARGVIAVVAPWNFPLAIPCGMTVAALAAGNAAILKSARPTPLIAQALVNVLHEAGVPRDALIHLPGPGARIGAALLADPRLAGCVFTGSKGVGTAIHQQLSARAVAGRSPMVITEMGGKNAVIVTANADLDEAVSGCLYGAFGHAGQKCSAASRLLVDRRILATFVERLVGAAGDWQLGAALAVGTQINPVINLAEATRLREIANLCRVECQQRGGQVLLDRSAPSGEKSGNLVGPAIFLLPPEVAAERTSQAMAEHFGPILHVIPFDGLEQAIALFNGSEYALTGGIFSQSQDDVDWLCQRAACGNLYVNRSNTGARVAIEPFGGFKMSGTGPKAGGDRYVRAFYQRHEASAQVLPRSTAEQVAALVETDLQRALAAALRLRQERRGTRRIPGQDNHNRWDMPRGRVCVVATSVEVELAALQHLIAALTVGNAVHLALLPAARHWRPALAPILRRAAMARLLTVRELTQEAELPTWLRAADPSVVVFDGSAQSFRQTLADALAEGATGDQVWAIYGVGDGPVAGEWSALLRCHLHVRTVAVNTMRHGAPLSLAAIEQVAPAPPAE